MLISIKIPHPQFQVPLVYSPTIFVFDQFCIYNNCWVSQSIVSPMELRKYLDVVTNHIFRV